jgi:hypothetical protein
MFRGTRRYNKNPQRRKVPGTGAENKLASRTPIQLLSAAADVPTNSVELGFDQNVFIADPQAFAQWVGMEGRTITDVTQVNGSTYNITFSTSVAVGVVLGIPFESPAVRNAAGGYIRTESFTTTLA